MSTDNQSNEKSLFREYNLFILIYILVFSVIPIFTRNVIPVDMIENLYWGKELQLGYGKHPPLFAWISHVFYKISFSWAESLYFLTQINLLLGFYFIFKISDLIFANKEKAYASIFIFMSSIGSVFGNEKFNATTILMSLLPAVFYFFLKMLKFRTKKDAVLLGIFSSFAFLGKYFALLFLGCMGIFLLIQKDCRDIFKTSLPYIAVITFLICISWHLQWIYTSDFVTVKYALEKSLHAKKDFLKAFNFLKMQFIFYITSFLGFAYAYSSETRLIISKNNIINCFKNMNFWYQKGEKYSIEERFVLFITVAPCAILFFISLITGMHIGSFWGASILMLLGVYLLIINKKRLYMDKLFIYTKYISIFFSIILIIKLGIARLFLKEIDPLYAIDYRKVAKHIENDWQNRFGNQKITCLKADKKTAALHIYLKDSPSRYDVKNLEVFLIYDNYIPYEGTIATFLCRNNSEKITKFREFYNGHISFDSTISIINNWVIYYAFLLKTKSQ